MTTGLYWYKWHSEKTWTVVQALGTIRNSLQFVALGTDDEWTLAYMTRHGQFGAKLDEPKQ
jgi:hypothetical protein